MKKWRNLRKRQKFTALCCIPLALAFIMWILVAIQNFVDSRKALDSSVSNANAAISQMENKLNPTPDNTAGGITIVKGANHELDEVAPQIEALFDDGNCKVSLENSKLVARITIPELEDAVAAIDEGDYSEWSSIIGEYKGHSERMAELAADDGLEYPIIIYGQNANGDILFTLNGTSVIFAAYEEPEEEMAGY